jgi:YD repeat-containing protein
MALAYDGLGRLTSQTDPLGKVTSFGYDARNRRTSVTPYLLAHLFELGRLSCRKAWTPSSMSSSLVCPRQRTCQPGGQFLRRR